MDITPLVTSLRQDLARAAEVGGEDVKAAAERLLMALDPALRLTLLEALSQAAGDVSAALPGVTVGVRLQGREPVFVVEGAPTPQAGADDAFETDARDDDGGEATARITLRIPESIKTRAEAQAARRGQSLNTWLVAAAARAAASDKQKHQYGEGHSGFPSRRVKGWVK